MWASMSPRTNSPPLCVPDTQRDTQVSLKKREEERKKEFFPRQKLSAHSHLQGDVGLLVDLWGGDGEGDGPGRQGDDEDVVGDGVGW